MPLWVVYTQGYLVNSAVIISMPLWVVYTQGYSVNSAVIISMPLWVVYTQVLRVRLIYADLRNRAEKAITIRPNQSPHSLY